jgi:hypothetical protein
VASARSTSTRSSATGTGPVLEHELAAHPHEFATVRLVGPVIDAVQAAVEARIAALGSAGQAGCDQHGSLPFRGMSNDEPQPAAGSVPPSDSVPSPAPTAPGRHRQPAGVVPDSIGGVFYGTGLVILLTILTLGIWGIFWTYRTSEDLRKYNGDGLGGVLGVVIYLLLSVVLMFTIPNEIKNMYERDGRQSPITALWGLWFLLPLIGHIVWYVRVQRALNDFWLNKGARPA